MAKNGNGNGEKLDLPALENWLWEAACVIRGPLDAPKYKDYILPLVFLERLSDVFDEEITLFTNAARLVLSNVAAIL